MICQCLADQLFAEADKSRYFAQPRPIIVNNFIAKLRALTEGLEGGRRKSRANPTRVRAVSCVCFTFGVQNLNPQ